MTSRFTDKFDRPDGELGANFTTPCGGALIADEAVIPVDATEILSGFSPSIPEGSTAAKTQVFYTAESLDGPDYVVRGTFALMGDPWEPVDTPPSFTLLARMSKDPLLYDLGTAEDPACYDQGYGARVTFPLDGTAPVLKIIKFMPLKRLPGLSRPTSTEVDGAVVLAESTLEWDDLNLDPSFDPTDYDPLNDTLPYQGYWQDMRLSIQRRDSRVDLDVYLNDRNMNTARMTHKDIHDPLWGAVGLPGFEFLSAVLTDQPAGASPFDLAGYPQLRCGLFSTETFRSVNRPVRVTPGGTKTYRDVVNRTLLLVEKQGDARYNATTSTQTKFDTYLDFVLEAEADIIRRVGYFEWLKREGRIYLRNGVTDYDLPEDCGLVELIAPGNWNNVPLAEMTTWELKNRVGSSRTTCGKPYVYTMTETGPDSRKRIRIFPAPGMEQIPANDVEDPYLVIDYFARQLRPDEPDVQIPFVPQENIDVLIYGAAAHALLLDTDVQNSQAMSQVYQAKMQGLIREAHRKVSAKQTVMSSVADLNARQENPVTRATSLNQLLAF